MPTPAPNYTGTHGWDPQAILNYVLGQHGTAAPASGTLAEFLRVGAVVGTAPGTFGDGVDVYTWVDRRRFNTPHLDAITLFSTTTAGSAATATGTWLTGLGGLKTVAILLDITATSGLTPTLDVFIDTRLDGTSTINLAQYGLLVGVGKTGIILSKGQVSSVADLTLTSDAAAGAARNFGWGDDLRVRYIVSGVTGTFSFAVYLNGVG